MKSNFEFLNKSFPVLSNLGGTAENYIYSDTNSCLIKLGLFGETIVNLMLQLDGIAPPDYDNTHSNRIKLLKKEGLISQNIDDIFYALRMARNKAIHANYDSFEECVILLEMAHNLGIWFMQTYGDWQYKPEVFVLPVDQSKQVDFEALLKEKEALIEKLSEQIKNQEPTKTITASERAKRAASASEMMKFSEKETRYLIDEHLRKVGWEADTINLRYSKGTRPGKGKKLAIAEWQRILKLVIMVMLIMPSS